MSSQVRVAKEWKSLTSGSVFANTKWRTLRRVRVFTDGAWRIAFSSGGPFTATAAPDVAYGQGYGDKPERVTSDPILASVSGGSGPFAYAWSVTSTSGPAVTLSNPGNATTTAYAVLFNNSVTATVRCVVTDATGATAIANSLVSLEHGFF